MGKIIKARNKNHSIPTPYPMHTPRFAQEKVDWEQAVCSVCMEAPHNAVLLLCSSHEKGCRPYMCGTNFRHSNCLALFKRSYSKPSDTENTSRNDIPFCKKSEPTELCCPLCRGQVMGWTVVQPARKYLNKKKRSCMHDKCSFKGNYYKLKKHVKAEHKLAKARKVDPVLEQKWKTLESQREHQDVMSIIRSSMPNSVVMGDYVIDMGIDVGNADSDDDDDDDGDDDHGGSIDGSGIFSQDFFNYLVQHSAQHLSRRLNREAQRRQ